MNKIITLAVVITIVNIVTVLGATTNTSGIKRFTKEQERAIKELIDKKVEERLSRLRHCLQRDNREINKSRDVGSALWFCLEEEKLN